jgi:hypothetical protein
MGIRMNKLVLAVMLSLLPSPIWATTYYLATAAEGGSDSNSGVSPSTPWLTPNHAVNCGDVIIAAASTAYAASNFSSGNWGTVTCAAGNNVAWLTCINFDACKISASSLSGMNIGKSYWGVSGWEVTTTGANASCYGIQSTSGILHHIIFANDIANGCISSGFTTSSTGPTASEDYLAIIGTISWNATQTTAFCDSGITIYEPLKLDSAPGTHIYIAGNFSFDNASPTNCNAGSSTYDGNGIVLDDIGYAQSGGTPYDQQIVVDNNLAVFNGGYGLGTTGNGSPSAHIYFRGNTSAYNLQATNSDTSTCGDLTLIGAISQTEAYNNLIETKGATACHGPTTLNAFAVYAADATDHVHSNFFYSAAGNNTTAVSSSGFLYAPNNITGTDPGFVSISDPRAPNCSGKASVPDCMATVIANFTPTIVAAKAYGYQVPSSAPVYDPLFPQWVCNVNLPPGLVKMGCLSQSTLPASVTITNVQVQ